MWFSPDVIGVFLTNVVSFARIVVLRSPLFLIKVVSNPRMLSVRADYVLSSAQLVYHLVRTRSSESIKAIEYEDINYPSLRLGDPS